MAPLLIPRVFYQHVPQLYRDLLDHQSWLHMFECEVVVDECLLTEFHQSLETEEKDGGALGTY